MSSPGIGGRLVIIVLVQPQAHCMGGCFGAVVSCVRLCQHHNHVHLMTQALMSGTGDATIVLMLLKLNTTLMLVMITIMTKRRTIMDKVWRRESA
jgi:hypothetical protein